MSTLRKYRLRSVFELFVRFSGAGLVGTVAHYILLIALVEGLNTPPVLASSCGAILGALVNYVLNYHFTFKSSKRHIETLPKFIIVALVGWVINGFVVYVFLNMTFNYILAQIIATAVVLVWGFVANLLWTFVKPQHADTEPTQEKST